MLRIPCNSAPERLKMSSSQVHPDPSYCVSFQMVSILHITLLISLQLVHMGLNQHQDILDKRRGLLRIGISCGASSFFTTFRGSVDDVKQHSSAKKEPLLAPSFVYSAMHEKVKTGLSTSFRPLCNFALPPPQSLPHHHLDCICRRENIEQWQKVPLRLRSWISLEIYDLY
jgi:hypothetical protein